MSKIITNYIRGKHIESEHISKCLIINSKNQVLFSTGNDNDFIYPRSSIKIFQAIPFAESSAIKKYKLNDRQIALSCASHSGEKYHIKELSKWIQKLKIKKTKLKCGIHNPIHTQSAEKILLTGNKPNQLHNNCAGKHLAMLSATLVNKHELENYLDFNHPHQIQIRNILEKFSESKINKNYFSLDGCSAPQYALKIKNICYALSNLVNSYNSKFFKDKEIKILINSILKNPFHIGGSNNLDSNLMYLSEKNLFCKGGAEGVLLFANLEKKIVGLIKVVDGNQRALASISYELFKKLKILKKNQISKFYNWNNNKIFNHAGKDIGRILTKIV